MELSDLRPLTFGELLDRTFTYFRRHFWLFVAIMAVPQVIIVVVNTAWEGYQRAFALHVQSAPLALRGAMLIGPVVVGGIIILLAYFAVYAVALGATTFAVSEIYLGRAITSRAAYRRMRGRYWNITSLIGSVALRVFLIFFLIIVAIGSWVGSAGLFIRSMGKPGVVLFVVFTLAVLGAGFFLLARFALRYGCAVPALLLENLKAGAAIKRSIALTKKQLGRVFLVGVLMTLVTWVVALICEGPFLAAVMWMTLKSHVQPPFWLTVASNIAGGVGHAVTAPLLMIGLVLLYYDIRVRKEAFDLQTMISNLDSQASPPDIPLDSPSPAAPQLEKHSVVLLVLLQVLTLGLYYPVWFMRRRSAVNSLRSSEKLGLGVFILSLGACLLNISLNIANKYLSLPTVNGGVISLQTLSNLLLLVYTIPLVIQAFKVRRILEEHTTASAEGPFATSIALAQDSSLSAVSTFFFGIFYLQYKINQTTGGEGQPGTGTGVVPAI